MLNSADRHPPLDDMGGAISRLHFSPCLPLSITDSLVDVPKIDQFHSLRPACKGCNKSLLLHGVFFRGVLLVRHAKPGELPAERDCDSGSNGVKREGRTDALKESATKGPQSLRFEELLLWATGNASTGTIESVQAKFGGVDVIDYNARRRMSRSACFRSTVHGADGKSFDTHAARGAVEKPRKKSHRAKGPKRSSRGATKVTLGASSRSPEDAVRLCLVDHLNDYEDDVRAAFTIEMIVQAIGGGAKQRAVSRRLREKVFAASGPAGELLWRRLYAHSAASVAAGFAAL